MSIYSDSSLGKKDQTYRVGRYYQQDIETYITTLSKFYSSSQNKLVVVLKKEFKKIDIFQLIRTIGYLESLKKARIKDVRQYYRLFKISIDYLIKEELLIQYQTSLQFLQSLLERLFGRFVKYNNIDIYISSTIKFDKLYKEAIR